MKRVDFRSSWGAAYWVSAASICVIFSALLLRGGRLHGKLNLQEWEQILPVFCDQERGKG